MASSAGDEWQQISNGTADVLRATAEHAFVDDPRKIFTAGTLAVWVREVT